VRYNPYYRHMPQGLPHRPDLRKDTCYIIYNDDGTVATGPTGERYCFSEESARAIVAKLERAKKSAAATAARTSAAPATPTDDIVFPVADGKISIFRGDIFFFGADGKNHGVILHGATDPDREIVAALRDVVRALHRSGRAAGMTGLQLLMIDPMAGTMPRSPAIQPRLLKNRR
jgi:hypothetical protein